MFRDPEWIAIITRAQRTQIADLQKELAELKKRVKGLEMDELYNKAIDQIKTNAKSFLYQGVSHTATLENGKITIITFGRGGNRVVAEYDAPKA